MAKNQYLALLCYQLGDEVVKHFEFHGSVKDMVTVNKRGPWFNLVKQIRVVTNLLQLH